MLTSFTMLHPIEDLGRVDLAVETMTMLCQGIPGVKFGPELMRYFLDLAVDDWVMEDEDREYFKLAVCVAWNARQDQIRRNREY